MKIVLVSTAILVAFGSLSLGAKSPDLKQTRADFEKLAGQLPYLALESVLYDRPFHLFEVADPKKQEQHFRILGQVTDQRYPKEALLKILTHREAKVRTLAAVALFDREDPSVLPALYELCADGADTFPGHPELDREWLASTGIGPPAEKQSVGYIARAMINFYLGKSDCGMADIFAPEKDPDDEEEKKPVFAVYWAARKHRHYCTAWFAVQLERAVRGTNEVMEDRRARVEAVRKRIDTLPADDRTWIFLWLNREEGSEELVSEKELVKACQKTGPEKLFFMLENRIPCDDPDLQPNPDNHLPYDNMVEFVLKHADQLFGSEYSDRLLARGRQQKGDLSPWWAIAVARLKPRDASRILHEAMESFHGEYDSDERSTLCTALWQLCGRSETKFIVDWFYDETPQRGSLPMGRDPFIRAMDLRGDNREIIARLIADPRFSGLDWSSLEVLMRRVNEWSGTPVVTEDDLREAWHPLGYYGPERQAEAVGQYPKETAQLLAHLEEWRRQLRGIVPRLLEGIKSEDGTSGIGVEIIEPLPIEAGMFTVGIRWFSRFGFHFSIDLRDFHDFFIDDGPYMVEPPGSILGTFFAKLPASPGLPATELQVIVVFKDSIRITEKQLRTLDQLIDNLKEKRTVLPFQSPNISGVILGYAQEIQTSAPEGPSATLLPKTLWNFDFYSRIKNRWLQVQFSALYPPGTPFPESALKKVQVVLATIYFRSPPASSKEALETARTYLEATQFNSTLYDMSKPESVEKIKFEGKRAWRVSWKMKDFTGKGGQLVVIVKRDGNCELGWGE